MGQTWGPLQAQGLALTYTQIFLELAIAGQKEGGLLASAFQQICLEEIMAASDQGNQHSIFEFFNHV